MNDKLVRNSPRDVAVKNRHLDKKQMCEPRLGESTNARSQHLSCRHRWKIVAWRWGRSEGYSPASLLLMGALYPSGVLRETSKLHRQAWTGRDIPDTAMRLTKFKDTVGQFRRRKCSESKKLRYDFGVESLLLQKKPLSSVLKNLSNNGWDYHSGIT